MGFCPDCHYEYEAGIDVCPDCGTALTDKLPEVKPKFADEAFVALPDVPGRVYADMVRGALENAGIPCYVRGEGVVDAYGISGTGPVSKGVRVFVPTSSLQESLHIQNSLLDDI